MKWLGFRVPLAIVNKAHQANQLYPFAISLIDSVRTYERTCEKVCVLTIPSPPSCEKVYVLTTFPPPLSPACVLTTP